MYFQATRTLPVYYVSYISTVDENGHDIVFDINYFSWLLSHGHNPAEIGAGQYMGDLLAGQEYPTAVVSNQTDNYGQRWVFFKPNPEVPGFVVIPIESEADMVAHDYSPATEEQIENRNKPAWYEKAADRVLKDVKGLAVTAIVVFAAVTILKELIKKKAASGG